MKTLELETLDLKGQLRKLKESQDQEFTELQAKHQREIRELREKLETEIDEAVLLERNVWEDEIDRAIMERSRP